MTSSARSREMGVVQRIRSWLNIAEILLSSLARQCLDQRIENIAKLRAGLSAWRRARLTGKVKWRFTTADARIKLRRLYPSLP